MTPDEIQKLDDRTLDRVIAEALSPSCNLNPLHSLHPPFWQWRREGDDTEWHPIAFSTDLNACHEAEREIEKRGLAERYGWQLNDNIPEEHICRTITHMFLAMSATARQRAEALAAVLTESVEK